MNTFPYLCAAYVLIAVVLSLYSAHLAWRLHRLSRQPERDQTNQPERSA